METCLNKNVKFLENTKLYLLREFKDMGKLSKKDFLLIIILS